MKTMLPYGLLLSFILTSTFLHSQTTCTRSIQAFMAAPGGYSISGSALLEFSEFQVLNFDSAFGTQSGPDLHVYLAKNFEAPTAAGNTNIDLGQLISNSGAQSFNVPQGVAIGDYDYVLIHCKSFNHWWGGGLLGDINCATATQNLTDEISISPYPNPATNFVSINSPTPGTAKIVVVDINGRARITQPVSSQEQLKVDVSELEPGMFYILGYDVKGVQLFRKKIITL
jgi:hypothetical protein